MNFNHKIWFLLLLISSQVKRFYIPLFFINEFYKLIVNNDFCLTQSYCKVIQTVRIIIQIWVKF